VTVNSTSYPIYFTPKYNVNPTGLWIISVQDTASVPLALAGAIFPDWLFVNGQIKITNILGLTSGRTYNVSFAIIYG
jgi:hypothetical protein